ncbi:Hca operon transcriptional activator HcaR [Leucobacter sp. BZR 635]
MFTFVQLKSFVVVAKELHFGRAAEQLQMTQPPLSRQIRKLEDEVGFELFDRTKRQVTLTIAGETFLDEATKLLAIAEKSQELARRIADGKDGLVSVGLTGMAILALLPTLLDDIGEHAPRLKIEVQEMVTRDQIVAVLGGQIDVGLVRRPPDAPELDSVLVHTEGLVAAISSRHPLGVTNAPVRVSDLRDESFIEYHPVQAAYFHELVQSVLRDTPVHYSQQVTQVHSVIALAANNHGLAFVPESAMALQMAGVVFRPIAGFRERTIPLYAVWRKDNSNPAFRVVVKRLYQLHKRKADPRTPIG